MKRGNQPPEGSGRGIDWDAIRQRIDAFGAALDSGGRRGPDAIRDDLRARADALARIPDSFDDTAERLELLEFRIEAERWGVDMSLVNEVEFLDALTPVPCTPHFVIGAIQLRGRVVGVNDLRRLFQMSAGRKPNRQKIIVLAGEAIELGLAVDEVIGARTIFKDRITAPPAALAATQKRFVLGVTDDAMAVLDARALLADPSMRVNERVDN